jgi:hypothetical protein
MILAAGLKSSGALCDTKNFNSLKWWKGRNYLLGDYHTNPHQKIHSVGKMRLLSLLKTIDLPKI